MVNVDCHAVMNIWFGKNPLFLITLCSLCLVFWIDLFCGFTEETVFLGWEAACIRTSFTVQKKKNKKLQDFPPPQSRWMPSSWAGSCCSSEGLAWWSPRRWTQLSLSFWRFSQARNLDLWSRETRTAAASSPPFHMEICVSVVLQIFKTWTGALMIFPALLTSSSSFIRKDA